MNKRETELLNFCKKHPRQWHSFSQDALTKRTVLSLQEKQLIEIVGDQFYFNLYDVRKQTMTRLQGIKIVYEANKDNRNSLGNVVNCRYKQHVDFCSQCNETPLSFFKWLHQTIIPVKQKGYKECMQKIVQLKS